MPTPLAASPVEARLSERWRRGEGAASIVRRELAQETAIGLSYDSSPYVVIMATPADIEDLAVGFTVTEQVAGYRDIEKVSVTAAPEGLVADVLLRAAAGKSLVRARRRTLEARSSCG